MNDKSVKMNNKDRLKEGRTIYLKPIGNAARTSSKIIETIVTSVGRKYFTVDYRNGMKFHINGMIDYAGDYISNYAAYFSKDEIEEDREAYKLYKSIKDSHFSVFNPTLNLDQLRRINKIING